MNSTGAIYQIITRRASTSRALDRFGDGDRPLRHLGMHALDHAAFDLHHALSLVLRQLERGDQLAGMRDFIGTRREHRIAGLDLVRMNQRLAVEAHIARLDALGLDGKTLIHPNQIEACNAAFTPPPEEVAASRKMIAAFELPENRDKGVVQIEGRMVERMHAEMARRTVAIAEAIESTRS